MVDFELFNLTYFEEGNLKKFRPNSRTWFNILMKFEKYIVLLSANILLLSLYHCEEQNFSEQYTQVLLSI